MFRIFISFAVAFLAFCSCVQTLAGGSASEGEAMISGRVISYAGTPAPQTLVYLFPLDYDPVKDSTGYSIDTTDQFGNYTFANILHGGYTIQAMQLNNRTRAMVSGIHVAGDTITVPVATLQMPGSIKVTLPDSANLLYGYLYIPGTKIFILLTNQSSPVILDSVPAGIIPAIAYSAINTATIQMIRYNIPVMSGDTTIVHNSSWKYSRTIMFNTSATGADVTGNVYNFPLLVRLNSSNFDFSQAQNSGADIRFAKSDNAPLTYEIERWDAVNQLAEIWVKIDTILGNNSTQSIIMYYGNSKAIDSSTAANVFDTGNGFVGVWHMNENPTNGANAIKDRTMNAHDATPNGTMTTANVVDGMIGKALDFDGVNDYLNAGNVPIVGMYSLSAWVKINQINTHQRFICQDSGYTLWYDADSQSMRIEHHSGTAWRGIMQDGGSFRQLISNVWFYVVGTYDGEKARIYVNGVLTSTSNSIGINSFASTQSLLLGAAWDNKGYVNGMMDEIRIEKTTRSGDWIMLSFINQQSDNKLIVFNNR